MYYYIQSDLIMPDFVVDISEFWDIKMNSIKAFKTQFHDPESNEPETYISSPAFLRKIEARAVEFGHAIGVQYAEGFTVQRFPGVSNLNNLL
jgi:LmbE family N-acetylglucosaminyl deacetylase